MRALIIDPSSQSIEAVDIKDDNDIASQIGYDTIESDMIDDHNAMFFDEECFLRQAAGRFQLDKLIPVSGKAIIIGKDADDKLADVSISENELKGRLAFS